MRAAAGRASAADAARLRDRAEDLSSPEGDPERTYELALESELAAIIGRYPDPETVERYARELGVVDRERAGFSAG